jgi:hypothetical protein
MKRLSEHRAEANSARVDGGDKTGQLSGAIVGL